ncbi:hypothetical protein CISG_02728 [Coccidioides immitis RMSCC 3703]|uniref:Uncharacterized protein n=2 Tax=Coccidioides immitis TaxID=5501 RepID=A0A0J8RBC4_COCIT|nr:hypothetical protein CIRG_00345 [Coccidioides immitis RMSCC 2394]KMU81710.1 hypothetical protein CISG_02728 [Coccidioides immitis RMSCC 3703]
MRPRIWANGIQNSTLARLGSGLGANSVFVIIDFSSSLALSSPDLFQSGPHLINFSALVSFARVDYDWKKRFWACMRMSGPRLVEPQRELANAETISGLVEGGGLITFKGCLTHSPQPTGLNQCSLVVLKYLWNRNYSTSTRYTLHIWRCISLPNASTWWLQVEET